VDCKKHARCASHTELSSARGAWTAKNAQGVPATLSSAVPGVRGLKKYARHAGSGSGYARLDTQGMLVADLDTQGMLVAGLEKHARHASSRTGKTRKACW